MGKDEDALSVEEANLLDLLVSLIEQYEEKRYPVGQVKPTRCCITCWKPAI